MLDKARASRQHRVKSAAQEEIPLLNLRPLKDFLQPVTSSLPEWKTHLGTAVRAGREKLGDAYAAIAEVAARQKEAVSDRLAERKQRQRSARDSAATTASPQHPDR